MLLKNLNKVMKPCKNKNPPGIGVPRTGKKLRMGRSDLPVAYPRTDLASLILADPQRFWITGRLPVVDHTSHFLQSRMTPPSLACMVLASTHVAVITGGSPRPGPPLHAWIARHLSLPIRLQQVGLSYLLFLMMVTRKHSLEEAARFSGCQKSQCSRFLQTHSSVAISTLQK